MFSYKFTFDWSIIDKLCKIERFDTKWKLTPKQDKHSIESQRSGVLLDAVKASLDLEGYTLTYDEIGEFLDNIDLERIPNLSFKLFLGYYEALELIHETKHSLELNDASVQELFNTLIKFAPEERPGVQEQDDEEEGLPQLDMFGMPTTSVSIGKSKKPKKADVDELLFWFGKDQETHPIVKAAVFMHGIATQRPFDKHSGSLARIVNLLILSKSGFDWVSNASLEVELEHQKNIYKQLTKAGASENVNLTKWVHFYLDCLLAVTDKLNAKLETQQKKASLAPREKSIVKFIQQHPGCRSGDISEALKIPNPTVKRLLTGLVDMHILQRFGAGPGTNYTVL